MWYGGHQFLLLDNHVFIGVAHGLLLLPSLPRRRLQLLAVVSRLDATRIISVIRLLMGLVAHLIAIPVWLAYSPIYLSMTIIAAAVPSAPVRAQQSLPLSVVLRWSCVPSWTLCYQPLQYDQELLGSNGGRINKLDACKLHTWTEANWAKLSSHWLRA